MSGAFETEIHFVTNHLYRMGCWAAQETSIGKWKRFLLTLEFMLFAKLAGSPGRYFPSGGLCRSQPPSLAIVPTHTPHSKQDRLNVGVVGDRCDALRLVLLGADGAGLAGLVGLALKEDGGALLLGLALLLGVGLDADDELLTRAGETDVLDTEVDALLDVAVADLLVDNDTDGRLGHVVDDTSLSVEVLVAVYVLVNAEGGRAELWRLSQTIRVVKTYGMPFWTAPLQTTSTMSPTLYWRR